MSTYTSEPGTRLAGRYRLVDQAGAGDGWTFWKATDETLARSVSVLTFASDFPRITEAITAARAASRLNDPRFSQVFDVEDADELAYVVMEWVAGDSLLDMLADGPLDGPHAVSLAYEAARAITAAHAAGLAHLRLTPECLHWTRGSGVKITGLGIDAVLTGPDLTGPDLTGPTRLDVTGPDVTGPDVTNLDVTGPGLTDPDVMGPDVTDTGPIGPDVTGPQGTESQEAAGDSPELTDTRDLARLLYAALTGYWPGPGPSAGPADVDGAAADDAPADGTGELSRPSRLPPAPEADGVPRAPRQVSAAVPADIDDLTCRALFQRPSRHGPAPSTPAMLAEELADVAPPVPLPAPAAPTTSFGVPAGGEYRPTGPVSTAPRATASYRRPRGKRSSATSAIIGVVIVLVLAAAGVAGWSFSHRNSPSASAPPAGPRRPRPRRPRRPPSCSRRSARTASMPSA